METTIINVRKFPLDLHREARSAAVMEGITFRDWLIKAVKEKLERDKAQK
ncbi:hypothetical protein DFW101_3513 [Solidesulfovibrio carbinoliphilus subsp. oakridgensis]|uniref:Uncharacterized protein n=1 Tax=Solidesulfovibrio carbinoliphilus subsp. oakridgensis TaxID=694327 RepID=G7QC63_9BACT|nr:hypothetical protein [Solidesulfovibrio carbinoliphilus]EHJ49509.1 hypothetical protein DFW101_3513 [Solidesulfovibrio carbinoliphilus subsp. oakridgensis]